MVMVVREVVELGPEEGGDGPRSQRRTACRDLGNPSIEGLQV